jgi:hypothetical protein
MKEQTANKRTNPLLPREVDICTAPNSKVVHLCAITMFYSTLVDYCRIELEEKQKKEEAVNPASRA